MEILSVVFNWFTTNENGEEFSSITVGNEYQGKKCESITEYPSQGEGDKHWIDIRYSDGTGTRIFNINQVFYK